MTDIRTPADADTNPSQINLDKLAGDHDWTMEQLVKLVAHLEEYAYNETTEFDEKYTLVALIGAVKNGVEKATREAEQLNVNNAMPGYSLLAMRGPARSEAEERRKVSNLLARATDASATREELACCLQAMRGLAVSNPACSDDLDTLVRIIELRGYTVGWLSTLGGQTAHLADSRMVAAREPGQAGPAPDLRACLTADEIDLGARALTALLVGTLAIGRPLGMPAAGVPAS